MRTGASSGKRIFDSPTTPRMKVTFGNYVIELIFLNRYRRLPPRFWNLGEWKLKYKRACEDFTKFSAMHDKLSEPLYRQAVIDAVRSTRCTSLLSLKQLNKLDSAVQKRYEWLIEQGNNTPVQHLAVEDMSEYMQRNAKMVNTEKRSRFDRIRELENSGKI